MANLNAPFILQGLEAVRRYQMHVANPDPRMGGFTDKAKSRFRYDVLRAWITLRRIADRFTGPDAAAFKFIDLYARRMPENRKDATEFAAHGFSPVYDFDTIQTVFPEDGLWDVDEKTGVLRAPPVDFKMVSKKPPQLGGEPGGLPKASKKVQALYQQLMNPPREAKNAPVDPFVPDAIQAAVLKALKGRFLTQAKLCEAIHRDPSELHRGERMKQLKDRGLVGLRKGLGYFRPDNPPVTLESLSSH